MKQQVCIIQGALCAVSNLSQVLVRKFQVSHNLSLDGMVDFLDSRLLTDAGPSELIDDDDSDVWLVIVITTRVYRS